MKLANTHLVSLGLVIFLVAIYFHGYFNPYTSHALVDPSAENLKDYPPSDLTYHNAVKQYIVKKAFEQGEYFPLFSPYIFGGSPFSFRPETHVISFASLLFAISPTVWGTVKWNILIHVAFAGIFMYWLVWLLSRSHLASLVSSIVYTFNGFLIGAVNNGYEPWVVGYSIIPLVLALTFLGSKSKMWPIYAIGVGTALAWQIANGAETIFLYTTIIFGAFFAYLLIGKSLNKIAKAMLPFGLIVLFMTLGLTAWRVLPANEYFAISSRAGGLSFEDSFTYITKYPGVISLIEPGLDKFRIDRAGKVVVSDKVPYIGIVAFLLLVVAVYSSWKKKLVMFLAALGLLGIMLATTPQVYWIFWKFFPFFSKQRIAIRAFLLFVVAGSILAGLGAQRVVDWYKKKYGAKNVPIVSSVIVGLVIINLVVIFYNPFPMINMQSMIDNNHVLNYVSDQPGIFRTHIYESWGIDYGTGHFFVPLELEEILTYDKPWEPVFMNQFLTIGHQTDPAKFWGIMNVKYVVAQQEIAMNGLEFVNKFDACVECSPAKAAGPYLYENTKVLPRAFINKNGIIIIGPPEEALNVMYSLLVNPSFDPGNSVVVIGDNSNINEYDDDFLSKFKVVFLLPGSVDQTSFSKLQKFKDSGGFIIPDILNGSTSTSQDEVTSALTFELGGSIAISDEKLYPKHAFNFREINLPNTDGILVLSEKYSILSPGWKVEVDGIERPIYRANGAVTAIAVDSVDSLARFYYSPDTFNQGKNIAIFTFFIALLIILGWLYLNKK